MNVNIYGAGISGLTVAHELVEKGFNVTVYDKNDIVGGMARSVREKGNNMPTEHSWRGYGPFYYNSFDILDRIPIKEVCNDYIIDNKNGGNKIGDNKINNKNKTELFEVNEYTIEEVEKHTKEDDLWCYYKGDVYDLTKFVKSHPGGNLILKSGGKDLEKVWDENGVSWHNKNNSVKTSLKKLYKGKLKENFKSGGKNSIKNFKQFKNVASSNLNPNRLKFKLLYNKNNNNNKHGISFYDYPLIIYLLLKVVLSNARKKTYYKTRLDPILKNNVSKNTYNYLVDYIAGPGYGFDKNTMSLGHYMLFIEYNLYTKLKLWQVMNKPTNEAWFHPLIKLLKEKGVKFKLNSSLDKINYKNNKITNCIVNSKQVYADEHIIALNPFNFEDIIKKSNMKNMYNQYLNLNTVNNQISFRLGFNKKINFSQNNLGFVLVDSPYNITLYSQKDNWCSDVDIGKNLEDLWSGTIIQPYNNGSLYKKNALSLTKKQLINEIIHQVLECKELIKNIKDNNKGYILKKEDIIYSEIFEDWYYDNNMLKTKNKKWVNNFLNEEYRPKAKTDFNNLHITGSHCKTSVNIWSMESATESGKITSNELLKKYNKDKAKLFTHRSLIFFIILQKIDDLLYYLYLPQLVDCIIILVILFILYKILKYFKLVNFDLLKKKIKNILKKIRNDLIKILKI